MAVDADTLARARRGDPDARRAIVGAHAAEVVAIVGDAAGAEAVLAAVVADLPRYQLGVERLPGWIRTRAGNARKRTGSGTGTGTVPEPDLSALIDRVANAPMVVEAPRPRVRLGVAAAVVGAVAIAAFIIAWMRTPAPVGPKEGSVVATARRQVRMANGTAVVEAGATMQWNGGAIEQRAGTVYYRIERPVTITTPHGAIRAAHASGRVAIGATTVVTIDEGDAVVGAAAVTAGDRAELP